jgi:hypothetical protein
MGAFSLTRHAGTQVPAPPQAPWLWDARALRDGATIWKHQGTVTVSGHCRKEDCFRPPHPSQQSAASSSSARLAFCKRPEFSRRRREPGPGHAKSPLAAASPGLPRNLVTREPFPIPSEAADGHFPAYVHCAAPGMVRIPGWRRALIPAARIPRTKRPYTPAHAPRRNHRASDDAF